MSDSFRSFVHPLEIIKPNGPVQSLLDSDAGEVWIYGQSDVGLYEGNAKLPGHQVVTVHLTTHRLLFLNTIAPKPIESPVSKQDGAAPTPNLQISLADVRQIEYYMGFIRSSAKITLFLGENPDTWAQTLDGSPQAGPSNSAKDESNWDCGVCGFTNSGSRPTPVSTLSQTPRCALCGVVKDLVPSTSRPTTPAPPIQSPIPQSSLRASHPELNAGGEGFEIPCPRCTFLNRPELKRCEVCDGVLTPQSGNTPLNPREGSNAGVDSPAPRLPVLRPPANEKMATVRISFRKGGEKEVYKRLRTVLTAKAWEKSKVNSASRGNGTGSGDKSRTGVGIDGILQNISLENQSKQGDVEDAFKDLEALMVRAGDMVKLVQTLNTKLNQQQSVSTGSGASTAEDEAAQTFLRSSLVQLGLPAPAVTSDMMADERMYLDGLAKELGGLLTGSTGVSDAQGLMVGRDGKGLVGMDEVWGLWNRVRGVSLVSPSDFQKTIPLLAQHTKPRVEMMTFPTGLSVLHTPYYNPRIFSQRLVRQLSPEAEDHTEKSLSTVEIALYQGLSVGLAKELVLLIETQFANIIRDEQAQEQGGGERWYRNLILETQMNDI